MHLWSLLLFTVVAFFRKALCASGSPSDRSAIGNELTTSVNSQNSGADLTSSGYFGFLTNTINYVFDTGYACADIVTKRNERLDTVKLWEKKVFEETKPKNKFTDFGNCPPSTFLEPAEWDNSRIKNISGVLASISDFDPKSGELIELQTHPKTTYVYYQSCKDYDLFALRPAIYPDVNEKTPELALKYHTFIERLMNSVLNKIGTNPSRQIVFAGAGEAGAMALILAWRVYLSNDYLAGCGYNSNSLNQVAVVTFDTRSIVTQGRMENCPLGRHNILNFMSIDKQKDKHRKFDIGGYMIPVNSNPNIEHTASYPDEEILHYIENPEWKGKFFDLNQNGPVKLARKLIANHHAITKHASQNSSSAFKEFAPDILVRDHEWCAKKMSNILSLETGLKEGIIGYEIIKDQGNRIKKSQREVMFTLKSRSEGNKVIIATFSLEILKSNEESQVKIPPLIPISDRKISDRKKAKSEKWLNCINDLFSMLTNLKFFSPSNYGAKEDFEYTPAKFPARCVFTNLNTARNLKVAYTTDREAFYSIFSQILHREKPQSCEGQLKPPTIPDEDKGNRDLWLAMFKKFWGDVGSLVNANRDHDTLLSLGNIEFTERFKVATISGPPEYIFPYSFANLVDDINKCLSKNLGSSMINCKREDSLFAGINSDGINQCPAACKYEMGNTAGCERVLPCNRGNRGRGGIFLMMRGKPRVDLPIIIPNETTAAYMSSIPCEVDHGHTFHFEIGDKSRSIYNYQQMFATICIDPIRVDSLIKWDPKKIAHKDGNVSRGSTQATTKEDPKKPDTPTSTKIPKDITQSTTIDLEFEGLDSNSDYSNEGEDSETESENEIKNETKPEKPKEPENPAPTNIQVDEKLPSPNQQDQSSPVMNLMEEVIEVHTNKETENETVDPNEKVQNKSNSASNIGGSFPTEGVGNQNKTDD